MTDLSPKTNHENHLRNVRKIEKLEAITETLEGRLNRYRESTFSRFPFLFVALSTFGLVATLYGFEKVIDKFELFTTYPEILLATGVVILLATGTLYKKLN